MGDKNLVQANGLVVAASEKISMEKYIGLLLMLYNADWDMTFLILVSNNAVTTWKNILVNQSYKFSDLKAGVLQSSSGGKIFLLKTTDTSTFSYIDNIQVKKFHLEEILKNLILVPRIDRLVTGSSPFESHFVSYQGFVTEIKNLEIGIYELDSKVLLYTTFNVGCITLSLGSEVIISNAHLVKDYCVGASILVCCGLSCVKNSKPKDVDDESLSSPNDLYFVNFCIRYGLNIFDILWFERLLSRLKKKFSSLIADEVLYKQDSDFVKNILEYFLCVENETTNKKLSLVEEFLSCPHQCFPFLESVLPTSCCIPNLSSILDEVMENASWIDVGPRWKFCVGSLDNSVIVGILYMSTSGNFYIADRTLKLPVILSKDCDSCCHDKKMKEFKSSKCASVVAVQEYDLIVENITCKNRIQQSIRYLRTSFCRLHPLLSLCKSPASNSFTFRKFSGESEKEAVNVTNVHSNLQGVNWRFLVLSKIWTLQTKEVPSCSRALVLILPESSQAVTDISHRNKSILDDTFNFYDSGDDVEFANLISKLDFLHIREKEAKLGYVCFDATIQDCIIFPGHIYAVALGDGNSNFNLTFEDHSSGIFSWTITPDLKLIHDPVCTGKHCIADYEDAESHGIKEILLKRQLNRNWIVNCILQDKTYEDVEIINEGKSRYQSTATLCMSVRDCNSEESCVKVYVPRFPVNLHGLLPGAPLQLFGFLCLCSQSGSLYLKASSVFGIQLKQPKTSLKCRTESFLHVHGGNSFHCPVRSLCFVVKIMSAEIFLACCNCGRTFPKSCSCYSQQEVKLKLSALIDDGNQLLLAHCQGKTARKILNIGSNEWQPLVSYVETSYHFLQFSDKAFWSKFALLPVMNQIFNTYCLSKATSRQLMFEYICIPKPYPNLADVPSIWCRNAEEVDCQKHMRDLYFKLMNNGHNLI